MVLPLLRTVYAILILLHYPAFPHVDIFVKEVLPHQCSVTQMAPHQDVHLGGISAHSSH